jgi:hypothetical protein
MRYSSLLLCRVLTGLICSALLAACAPRPAIVPPPALPAVAPGDLLERVKTCGAAIDTVRGLAKVRLTNADRTLSLSQVLLAAYPDRLRTESLSPFGSPLLILASDGRDLDVLLPGEGRFLHGPASAENLRRFTRLPLLLTDLVGLLLYRPPLFPWQGIHGGSEGADRYRLFLDGPENRRQVFTFDAALRLTGAAYYRGRDLLLEVDYGNFLTPAPIYPRQAELHLPAYGVEATIRFSDVTLNADLPAERFRLQPPPGVKVEDMREKQKTF